MAAGRYPADIQAVAPRGVAHHHHVPIPMSTHPKFFEQVNKYVDRAARLLSLPDGLLQQIKACNAVYHVSFPLRRDDGTCSHCSSFDRS